MEHSELFKHIKELDPKLDDIKAMLIELTATNTCLVSSLYDCLPYYKKILECLTERKICSKESRLDKPL